MKLLDSRDGTAGRRIFRDDSGSRSVRRTVSAHDFEHALHGLVVVGPETALLGLFFGRKDFVHGSTGRREALPFPSQLSLPGAQSHPYFTKSIGIGSRVRNPAAAMKRIKELYELSEPAHQ